MSKIGSKRLSRKSKIIIGLLALICLAGVVAGCINNTLNEKIFIDQTDANNKDKKDNKDGLDTPSAIKNKVTNFLVLGISNDPSERTNDNLTDSMMLVSLDVEKGCANVLQIPRDTWVGEGKSPYGKINAIYNRSKEWDYNGIDGIKKLVNELFQVPIDHYVTVKMDGFSKIIDSIGGVNMNVPVDMELNGTEVKAGQQTLNGKQAIAVVRTRHAYKNEDDLSRLETQKLFLAALLEQSKSFGVGDMAKMLPSLMESLSTDLTINDALEYYKIIKKLDMTKITMQTVPGEGVQAYYKKQDVYGIYIQQTADLLNQYFRPYSDPVTADQLQIESIVSQDGGTQNASNNSN